MIEKGDRVHVDFTHQLEKNSPEIHFHGHGILDRVEDGRVYGRLDDGRPFTCMIDDVGVLPKKTNYCTQVRLRYNPMINRETLEQYQNTLKNFNDSTRKSYEEFIQLHGSDRQKLQLRFTPYTDKKGGYGSFDLDSGLQVWQYRQTEMDELHAKFDQLDQWLGQRNSDVQELNDINAKYVAEKDELQKRLDAASYLLPSIKAENDLWGCDQVERQIELLEQALKGTDR
ncbi:hypothetical protein [Acinetobacter haemolyticus]|uniref:hypothetical protein n=1 Tax=Acinetobacter haemolyticus TaxID=29430 RepID=UPI001D197914|nr:hypothetical protein [Acinetobacter haemolyticus]